MDSKIAAMTRGAPNDSAQHVLAIGVARHDAVGDEEGHCARMIRNRAIRDVAVDVFAVRVAVAEFLCRYLNFLDDGLEQIDVVIAEDLSCLEALQRGGDTLEPGSRIDMLLRQRGQLPGLIAVVLNENQVAEFDEALASVDVHETFLARMIFLGTTRSLTAIDADFRVITTWSCRTHLPEIILVAESQNPIARQHVQLDPDVLGLLVILMNCGVEELRIDSPDLGDELPMPSNRFFLVVVAE